MNFLTIKNAQGVDQEINLDKVAAIAEPVTIATDKDQPVAPPGTHNVLFEGALVPCREDGQAEKIVAAIEEQRRYKFAQLTIVEKGVKVGTLSIDPEVVIIVSDVPSEVNTVSIGSIGLGSNLVEGTVESVKATLEEARNQTPSSLVV